MSDYLDRLERELLAAGRRHQNAAAPSSPRRGPAMQRRWRATIPVILSLAVTIAVVAVVVAVSGTHHTSPHTPGHHQHNPINPLGIFHTKVSTAPACRVRHSHDGLPALIKSDANPGPGLASILGIARQPATGGSLTDVGSFDRDPVRVLTVFRRFVHVVDGAHETRLAFFPAVVCNETDYGPSDRLPQRVRIAPAQAMVMVVLSNPPPRTAILVGTASTIRTGPALPGLDLPDNRGWIQATVVRDGVSRVVMHFTPPFLHHYTATATVQDNVAIIVRKPDYTPTTVSWYAADGHLIHTFVNQQAIQYDQCLAQHRQNCQSP
jgi:hypothetical protein